MDWQAFFNRRLCEAFLGASLTPVILALYFKWDIKRSFPKDQKRSVRKQWEVKKSVRMSADSTSAYPAVNRRKARYNRGIYCTFIRNLENWRKISDNIPVLLSYVFGF
jgi:hypothetical protein